MFLLVVIVHAYVYNIFILSISIKQPMQSSILYISTTWQQVRNNWRVTFAMLFILNRRAELQRLEQWAKRRKFTGPQIAYMRQQDNLTIKLEQLRMRLPHLYHWARLLHLISVVISPTPQPRKGMGATYRRSVKRKYAISRK